MEIESCIQVPLQLSTVVLPASASGNEEDMNIALEIVSSGMDDAKEPDPVRSRFRQRILRALVCTDASWQVPMIVCIQDWTVIEMNIIDWRQCANRRSKCKLLHDLVKEQTGYESAFLLNDGKMDRRNEDNVSGEKGITKEGMVASNHSTATNLEESKMSDTEDSVPLPELSDDAEFTGTVVHTDHQDSSNQGECVFVV